MLKEYGIYSYKSDDSHLVWGHNQNTIHIQNNDVFLSNELAITSEKEIEHVVQEMVNNFSKEFLKFAAENKDYINNLRKNELFKKDVNEFFKKDILSKVFRKTTAFSEPIYIPSERIFISAIEYSWAGIMRDDIGLPKTLLDFANAFSLSRKDITELHIPFLSVQYLHIDGKDRIKIQEREEPLMLLETASGIQSVTPMLVLLEHLSRKQEQAQSFIIEEPELNLYPTAQQGLMNWLIEKCTKGENDLTITTHSPYILAHLNLLLFAHQVAENHRDRADDVAKVVPRESWIDPKEFACYQVENGGTESLVNEELGLIDTNGLDNLSGDAADAFDNLIRLSKSVALK